MLSGRFSNATSVHPFIPSRSFCCLQSNAIHYFAMQLILLSLLPLAVELTHARPAHQDSLVKRTAPIPVPQEQPFAARLPPDFVKGSASSFYGLSDDEVAQLNDIFTDDSPFAATISDSKVPTEQDFQASYLHDNMFADASATSGDKTVSKTTDEKTAYSLTPDPINPKTPVFDPSFTDIFDENGLPTQVAPGGFGSAKLDLGPGATSADPKSDYSIFLPDDKDDLDTKKITPPIPLSDPAFDPALLPSFDKDGLPVVKFNPDEDVSAKLNVNLAASTPDPRADTSVFTSPLKTE